MKRLRNCPVLKEICTRCYRPWVIIDVACLICTLLFPITILAEMPFAVSIISMLMVIPTAILFITIMILRHASKKALSQFTDSQLQRIDNEIAGAETFGGFAVTSDAVICINRRFFICPVDNILWVYEYVISTTVAQVADIKQTSVFFCQKNKKRYVMISKNKFNIVPFLQYQLSQYRRDIIYGFSDTFDNLFKYDMDQLIEISKKVEQQSRI